MQEFNCFAITAESAFETAAICYRQSVKDFAKVYRIARPIVLYTLAVFYVLGGKAYAAGARFRTWSDNLVESNLIPSEQPAPTPIPIAPPVPARAAAKSIASPATLVVKPESDLAGKSLTELRAIAQARGISTRSTTVDRRLNKKELLAALS